MQRFIAGGLPALRRTAQRATAVATPFLLRSSSPHTPPTTHALGLSRRFSSKPWASVLEWGEERRAESQRPGASKPHVVHLHPRKNNTFVTVTDADGNKKYSASIGSLHLGKGANVPRFFAEPVAEHAGQAAVKMGVKSAVVRVKGSIYFKKKKDMVLSWRKGTRSAGKDQCRILSIQDVTRLAHNGCRLRKRRRI